MPAFFSRKQETVTPPLSEVKLPSEEGLVTSEQPMVTTARERSAISSLESPTPVGKTPISESALKAPEAVIIQQEPQEKDPKEAKAWDALAQETQKGIQ
ncbi:hypothetical protein COT51_02780 [candidate division WWE3 bacterium CG08_land_8_20_14_0_20_41_15]|uniref:Uncharacterized protein n=1 Tax=candidate division WWE3 bacterium CG08_land_8_20_14_0_20_41_15 TaxID=1975086 RepID=A0A2H0XB76_UNCKA|nr:MAG: hypothetical protein COT51_02780 [candidate division WWE3 bacterium CG08_land_8_20_14_0_20_41_15]